MSIYSEGKSCGLVRSRLELLFSMTLLLGEHRAGAGQSRRERNHCAVSNGADRDDPRGGSQRLALLQARRHERAGAVGVGLDSRW